MGKPEIVRPGIVRKPRKSPQSSTKKNVEELKNKILTLKTIKPAKKFFQENDIQPRLRKSMFLRNLKESEKFLISSTPHPIKHINNQPFFNNTSDLLSPISLNNGVGKDKAISGDKTNEQESAPHKNHQKPKQVAEKDCSSGSEVLQKDDHRNSDNHRNSSVIYLGTENIPESSRDVTLTRKNKKDQSKTGNRVKEKEKNNTEKSEPVCDSHRTYTSQKDANSKLVQHEVIPESQEKSSHKTKQSKIPIKTGLQDNTLAHEVNTRSKSVSFKNIPENDKYSPDMPNEKHTEQEEVPPKEPLGITTRSKNMHCNKPDNKEVTTPRKNQQVMLEKRTPKSKGQDSIKSSKFDSKEVDTPRKEQQLLLEQQTPKSASTRNRATRSNNAERSQKYENKSVTNGISNSVFEKNTIVNNKSQSFEETNESSSEQSRNREVLVKEVRNNTYVTTNKQTPNKLDDQNIVEKPDDENIILPKPSLEKTLTNKSIHKEHSVKNLTGEFNDVINSETMQNLKVVCDRTDFVNKTPRGRKHTISANQEKQTVDNPEIVIDTNVSHCEHFETQNKSRPSAIRKGMVSVLSKSVGLSPIILGKTHDQQTQYLGEDIELRKSASLRSSVKHQDKKSFGNETPCSPVKNSDAIANLINEITARKKTNSLRNKLVTREIQTSFNQTNLSFAKKMSLRSQVQTSAAQFFPKSVSPTHSKTSDQSDTSEISSGAGSGLINDAFDRITRFQNLHNIYESLEEGNGLEAFDFSDNVEPSWSMEKPWRVDESLIPRRSSIGNLPFLTSNKLRHTESTKTFNDLKGSSTTSKDSGHSSNSPTMEPNSVFDNNTIKNLLTTNHNQRRRIYMRKSQRTDLGDAGTSSTDLCDKNVDQRHPTEENTFRSSPSTTTRLERPNSVDSENIQISLSKDDQQLLGVRPLYKRAKNTDKEAVKNRNTNNQDRSRSPLKTKGQKTSKNLRDADVLEHEISKLADSTRTTPKSPFKRRNRVTSECSETTEVAKGDPVADRNPITRSSRSPIKNKQSKKKSVHLSFAGGSTRSKSVLRSNKKDNIETEFSNSQEQFEPSNNVQKSGHFGDVQSQLEIDNQNINSKTSDDAVSQHSKEDLVRRSSARTIKKLKDNANEREVEHNEMQDHVNCQDELLIDSNCLENHTENPVIHSNAKSQSPMRSKKARSASSKKKQQDVDCLQVDSNQNIPINSDVTVETNISKVSTKRKSRTINGINPLDKAQDDVIQNDASIHSKNMEISSGKKKKQNDKATNTNNVVIETDVCNQASPVQIKSKRKTGKKRKSQIKLRTSNVVDHPPNEEQVEESGRPKRNRKPRAPGLTDIIPKADEVLSRNKNLKASSTKAGTSRTKRTKRADSTVKSKKGRLKKKENTEAANEKHQQDIDLNLPPVTERIETQEDTTSKTVPPPKSHLTINSAHTLRSKKNVTDSGYLTTNATTVLNKDAETEKISEETSVPVASSDVIEFNGSKQDIASVHIPELMNYKEQPRFSSTLQSRHDHVDRSSKYEESLVRTRGRPCPKSKKKRKTEKKDEESQGEVDVHSDSPLVSCDQNTELDTYDLRRFSITLQSNEEDYINYMVDGNSYTYRCFNRYPSETEYKRFGNLDISEYVKHPQNIFSAGYLRLQPGERKRRNIALKYYFIYNVIKGRATVDIHNRVRVVEQGGFVVPLGVEYSIKNMDSEADLILAYTRIRGNIGNSSYMSK